MALRPRPCFSSNWLPWVVAAWQTVGTVGLVIRNFCSIMENHYGSYLCIGKSTINGPLSIATLHYRSVPQSSFIQMKQWARNLGVTDLNETMFYIANHRNSGRLSHNSWVLPMESIYQDLSGSIHLLICPSDHPKVWHVDVCSCGKQLIIKENSNTQCHISRTLAMSNKCHANANRT